MRLSEAIRDYCDFARYELGSSPSIYKDLRGRAAPIRPLARRAGP